MIRCLILAEGQSEQAFIKEVLSPHLSAWGLHVVPVVAKTSRPASGPVHAGGVPTFGRLQAELQRLFVDRQAVVTTMVDYFQLPPDTPGFANRPHGPGHSARNRADHVGRAIETHFGNRTRFHAYLSLHEFEALVLAAPDALADVLGEPALAPALRAIVDDHGPPETINDRPDTAPAARIAGVAPRFRKLRDGPPALSRAGLAHLRAACPHFHAWVSLLESYGTPAAPSAS